MIESYQIAQKTDTRKIAWRFAGRRRATRAYGLAYRSDRRIPVARWIWWLCLI